MPLEDHLTGDAHDRYVMMRDDPVALVEALRFDVDLLVTIAEADTAPMLRQWFSELGIHRDENGWQHVPGRTGPIGEFAAGVEWQWTGVHDDGGEPGGGDAERSFNGIPPSGNVVTVHGFTLFGVELDDLGAQQARVRRYVDWAGVFAQLGLTLNWRTPV
jgi:hypothetical protein